MPDRPTVHRRTAVAGMVGGLLAAGLGACDVDDLRPPDSDGSATPSAEPGQPTPDEALVDEVLAALGGAVDLIAAARAFGPLRRLLGPVARAHEAHRAVLGGGDDAGTPSTTPATPPATPPASAAVALEQVRVAEQQLHARLVDASVGAESGALARLLASMSASVSQYLAVLPAQPPGGAAR